jgi:hypothetical protein
MRSQSLCESRYLKADETGVSLANFLLVNSIPLVASACKAPAQCKA